jgi:uncharacterized integral membrane protein
MRIVTWTLWLVVFLILMGFVAKNVEPVNLRFYFDRVVNAPLIVIIFASFACGAVFGILALLATLLRQRREIARLKRAARLRDAPSFPPVAGL